MASIDPMKPKFWHAETIDNIERQLGMLAGTIREWMPPSYRERLHGLELWQWIALPMWLLALVILAFLITAVIRLVSRALLPRQEKLRVLRGPLRLFFFFFLMLLTDDVLGFPKLHEQRFDLISGIGIVVAVFWGAVRFIDYSIESYEKSQFAHERPDTRALVSLGSRAAKFFLLAIAAAAIAAQLGYKLTTLLAGLGIGGLALAFAAQKTLENVFGAFSLALDNPFREGDLVRVDGFLGRIERIGLRSTSLRTVERTVVFIPNGKLSTLSPENYAMRDRFRMRLLLRLSPDAPAAAFRKFQAGVAARVATDPIVDPMSLEVFYTDTSDRFILLDVDGQTRPVKEVEFEGARSDIYLDVLELMEENGIRLAMPEKFPPQV